MGIHGTRWGKAVMMLLVCSSVMLPAELPVIRMSTEHIWAITALDVVLLIGAAGAQNWVNEWRAAAIDKEHTQITEGKRYELINPLGSNGASAISSIQVRCRLPYDPKRGRRHWGHSYSVQDLDAMCNQVSIVCSQDGVFTDPEQKLMQFFRTMRYVQRGDDGATYLEPNFDDLIQRYRLDHTADLLRNALNQEAGVHDDQACAMSNLLRQSVHDRATFRQVLHDKSLTQVPFVEQCAFPCAAAALSVPKLFFIRWLCAAHERPSLGACATKVMLPLFLFDCITVAAALGVYRWCVNDRYRQIHEQCREYVKNEMQHECKGLVCRFDSVSNNTQFVSQHHDPFWCSIHIIERHRPIALRFLVAPEAEYNTIAALIGLLRVGNYHEENIDDQGVNPAYKISALSLDLDALSARYPNIGEALLRSGVDEQKAREIAAYIARWQLAKRLCINRIKTLNLHDPDKNSPEYTLPYLIVLILGALKFHGMGK